MLKRAGAMSIGALVAQAISFGALPILARIYGPVELGKYSILVAISLMLTPIATLKLETLIVVEKNDQIAGLYLRLAIFMTLFISILSMLFNLAMALASKISHDLKFNYYWFLLSLLITVNSIVLLSLQVTLRNKSYNLFSLTGIFHNFFIALFQMSLSLVVPKAINLFFGLFFGKIIGISLILGKAIGLSKIQKSKKSIYFETLRRIYPQIKLLNQGSLLEAIAVGFPTVYIGIIFGHEFAGIFSLSQVLLMAPIVLVGSGIGSLLLSEFSEVGRPQFQDIDSQTKGIRKVFLILVCFSLLYLILNYLFAELLVEKLMGSEWFSAVELFSLIIVPYSIGLVWYPMVNLFWSKQDWRSYRQFSLVRMILPMSAALLSYIFSLDWKLTVCLISWGTAISQIYGIYILNSKWNFLKFTLEKANS